jgi:hypothetical protein
LAWQELFAQRLTAVQIDNARLSAKLKAAEEKLRDVEAEAAKNAQECKVQTITLVSELSM